MSETLEQFLAGVSGVVEANTFERHSLWLENDRLGAKGRKWEENLRGYIEYVRWVQGRPICVSMFKATIDGQSILFWDATSQLVDYAIIEDWLEKVIPKTARDERGRINKTDAMNFCNVLHRAKENAQ